MPRISLVRDSLLLALVLSVTAAILGCSSNDISSPTPSPTPAPTGPVAGISIVSGASVLTTTAYSPASAEVTVGTTVTWTNNDNMQHTTTANGGQWNSGTIQPGRGFSFTFQTAGTFPYHCTFHPGMTGTIVVR